jgi:hypothetical protein
MLRRNEARTLTREPRGNLSARRNNLDARADAGKDYRYHSPPRKRELVDATSVANCLKNLDHLPELNCSLHIIMRGNFVFSDIIPTVLKLAAPATIDYLAVTTLGFSKRASAIILDTLDSGNARAVDFICTDYFERVDNEICQEFRFELTRRGSRFASAKSHAKIVLFQMTDGRCYTVEGSANIRSCRNVEQFAMTQDPDLLAFHREWIDKVMELYVPQKASR